MHRMLLKWVSIIFVIKVIQTICFRVVDVNYALRCSTNMLNIYYSNKDGQFYLVEFVALLNLAIPVMVVRVLLHATYELSSHHVDMNGKLVTNKSFNTTLKIVK